MERGDAKLAGQLAANVRAQRRLCGLTQAMLAERADLSPHYIALIETGQKLPTLRTLAALASALDTGPDRLLAVEAPADGWSSEVAALAANVPPAARPYVLDVLRAAIRHARADADRVTRSRRRSR